MITLTRMIAFLLVGGYCQGAVIPYDFDDGTLQGWTSIMSGGFIDRGDAPGNNQTQGAFRFDVIHNSESLSNGAVGGFLGASETAHAGDYRILPTPFYDRDSNTNTLLLRSPAFLLDGTGDLTAQLRGGDEDNAPPATSALLPAVTTGVGFQGIALRRVSDDAYVLFDGRTSNASNWQEIMFSQVSLAGFVSPTELYTLDLIDNANGSWGWIGLDTVSIPGAPVPEPGTWASFALLAICGATWIRRSRRCRPA